MAGKGKQNDGNENGGGKAPKRQSRNNRFNPIANSNARDPTGEGEWTEVTRKDGGNRSKNNDKNGNHPRNNSGHGQQNQNKSGPVSRQPKAAKSPNASDTEKLRDYCVVYSDQALGTERKKYWKFFTKNFLVIFPIQIPVGNCVP